MPSNITGQQPSIINDNSLGNLNNQSAFAGQGRSLPGLPQPNKENQNPNNAQKQLPPKENNQVPQDDLKKQLGVTFNEVVSEQRSQLYANNDRYMHEQVLMRPLNSGGGLLGTTRIILEEKVALLKLDKAKTLTNDQMLIKLRQDGVYVDDPQIYQKFTDINMQKLEERILREKPFFDTIENKLMAQTPKGKKSTQYFKMNGEIKLNNDLLADEITRPADLAFESTEAFQTKEVNSILCNRLHSFKKRYYRLDIVVGKICLLKYPEFFSAEDRLAIELRELYKEYERRTSLAMIPFYMERLKFIEEQQYHKQRNPMVQQEELEFLRQNVEDTQRKLDQEKREVEEMARKLYGKWKEIKEVRKTNGFSGTNVKLKVHKSQPSGDNAISNEGEFYFNLMHEEPSGKKFNGTALPNSEVNRRNNAMRVRAYVRLVINGKYVSRTRKAFLKWPNFEIEIGEMFQVCLFTMPSSIQLEVVVGTFSEYLIDVLNIEVPGQYVKALTSASSLVKELSFSKFEFEKRKQLKKYLANNPGLAGSEAEKKKYEIEQARLKTIEDRDIANDVNGVMYIKAEWKGEGPDMPPMRSENLFKQRKAEKVRLDYDEDQQDKMLLRQLYIDVNDPRNERIIKFLKETKNEFLQKLLSEDSKNPLFSLKPFRHMLLDARSKDPEIARKKIPMLEKEIIENKELLDKLEIIFREEAYREYLNKKAEDERNNDGINRGGEKVHIIETIDSAAEYDAECIKRRQIFYDKLKQYQREVKAGFQKAQTQYKSVVREFELLESENPLVALFNKMFITGRKLKPVVQKRQPVSLDSVKETKIMIHIIKGFNVPIRKTVMSTLNEIQNRRAPMPRGGLGGLQPTAVSRDFMARTNNNNFNMGVSANGMSGGFAGQSMGNGFGQSMGNGFGSLSAGYGQNKTEGMDIRLLDDEQKKLVYGIKRVQTVVEVKIVYNEDLTWTKITNVAEGDSPEWNQILEFSLVALNKKFTKQELLKSKTMIYVNLFDQEEEFSNLGTGLHLIQTNFRFLGSFSIPLISILNNPPKIEANFKLNRPYDLLNYEVKKNSLLLFTGKSEVQDRDKSSEPNTYISMSISLDPVLELPLDPELEYYPGFETSSLLIAVTDWVKELKKGKFEKRNIKCLGENVSGQSILICRYLTPQAPPKDIYDVTTMRGDVDAIEKAARYVSLIPFAEDNQSFNVSEIFCNSQEFLDLGMGDYEEHAILLCNYFNYIDREQAQENYQSYLVLGTGLPEGKTAYVMRQNKKNNHVELWNPILGEAYFFGREEILERSGCLPVSRGFKMNNNPDNAKCQLTSVGCIISSENIWANTSEYESPGLLNFDLTTSSWKSFFKGNLKKYFPLDKIQTIQPEPIQYMKIMSYSRSEVIAQKIRDFLTQKFENERIKEKKKTSWNIEVEKILHDILQSCEGNQRKSRQGATNSSLRKTENKIQNSQLIDIKNKIMDQAKGQNVWGFPINIKFISMELLWEEVKNTKLHLISAEEEKFSLQVHVEPYSHNVLSVWVFLLAFTKDRGIGR